MKQTGQRFLIYSFLGWMLEGMFQFAKEGTFRKPNFLHGPVKPMYGVAGVLLTNSYRYDKGHFGYYCVCLPLMVEYISAMWLERSFALKYWDYSKEFLQMGGRICFKFALCWFVLAQFAARCVQPMVNVLLRITGRLSVWRTFFQLFFLDCVLTIHHRKKTASN